MIEFQEVSKTYRIIKSRPGLTATVGGLFAPKYTYIKAIQDLSLSIRRGELVGLIGENGAGKSTLVKLATGILRPDHGCVLIDGLKVHEHRRTCALQFGVAFGQRRSLWWQLSAREGLAALARIYKVRPCEVMPRIQQLIHLFELEQFVDSPVRQLSLGQRIRCEVASCFIHRPKIVFLDEPTIGMDVMAKIRMRDYLKRINREDEVAVLLTSHDLFDVERVCQRAIILDKGRLLLDTSFESMRREYCVQRVLHLTLGTPFSDGQLEGLRGIEIMPDEDRWRLNLSFDPVARPVMGLMAELQDKLDIVDFVVEDLPIDEFVAQIYRTRASSD